MNDTQLTGETLARLARTAIEDKKGVDPVILDVRGISDITDFLVIATGNNHPHLKALMGECERVLKDQRNRKCRVSGKPESGWLVADYMDVIVHILTPDARKYYALEALWRDAKLIE